MPPILLRVPRPCCRRAPAPADIGDRKQLFIDDRFIADRDRVELRANPPEKLGLLRDEKGLALRGHIARVIDDAGKVRLYLGHEDVQVLESDDGLHFRRNGVKLPGGTFPMIFLDPHETDPARRYKLFHLEFAEPFDPARHGVYASYSADGVTFTKVGRVFPFFTDNPTIVHWDGRIRKYVIYTRAFDYGSENQRRIGRIGRTTRSSRGPIRGRPHRVFPSIENIPVVYSADRDDDPHSDVYYNAAGPYPWGQDVYLMFPAHFRHFLPDRHRFIVPPVKGRWEDFGMLEVQLAVSRDGVRWSRPSRGEPYIPPGLADEWDRWYTVAAPGLVRRGNSIYQYYYSTGRSTTRPSCGPSTRGPRSRWVGWASCGSGWTGSCRPTPTTRGDGCGPRRWYSRAGHCG